LFVLLRVYLIRLLIFMVTGWIIEGIEGGWPAKLVLPFGK